MQTIELFQHVKNEIKHPFVMLTIIIILCTLFFFLGLQASLLFKVFIITAIISTVIAFFYNLLIGAMIVLIFVNFENLHDVTKNINGNYHHINATTLEERREAEYNHMEYKFIRDVTSRFSSLNFFPTLYYPNYDFGVRALLPGYRNEISTEVLGIMDLDATMTNVNGLNCSQTNLQNSSKLSCELKDHPEDSYVFTGIHFDSDLIAQEEYDVVIMNNESVIESFSLSIDEILNTKRRRNLIKFNAKEVILPNFNKSVLVYKPITTKDLLHGNTLEIIVNGKSAPKFNLSGHKKNVPEHLILEWDTYDAGSYIAITNSALSDDRVVSDNDTEKAIFDLLILEN